MMALIRGLFNVVKRSSIPLRTETKLWNSSYSAAIISQSGKPLTIQTLNPTKLVDGEVRIKVEYCSLNSNDVDYIEHLESDEKLLPFIPGYELSGEILEVADNCPVPFSIGQRVAGLTSSGYGGLAGQAVLRALNVWPLPSEVGSRDAAALVCGHSTALLAFTEHYQLNENDVILIIAGAGGYGMASVEVAANIFKAKVIAIADTDGKASLLRERGAFAAFKNNPKRNYKEIMNICNNTGVNLIYDAVGGSILSTVAKCLKDQQSPNILTTYRRQKYIDKNAKAEDKEYLNLADKLKTVNIFDFRTKNHEKYYSLVEQTLSFCEEQLLTAHISKIFELEDINNAIDYIKGKMCTGKVLIKIDD